MAELSIQDGVLVPSRFHCSECFLSPSGASGQASFARRGEVLGDLMLISGLGVGATVLAAIVSADRVPGVCVDTLTFVVDSEYCERENSLPAPQCGSASSSLCVTADEVYVLWTRQLPANLAGRFPALNVNFSVHSHSHSQFTIQ